MANLIHPIKYIRLRSCISQKDLANQLGISKQYLNNIENYKRVGQADFWLKIKEYFKLSDKDIEKLLEYQFNVVQKEKNKIHHNG